MKASLSTLMIAVGLCVGSLGALACNIPEITRKIADANEHEFWVDFWADFDPTEARSEKGYYTFGLRSAREEANENGCDEHRSAVRLRQYVQHKLDALTQKELALNHR